MLQHTSEIHWQAISTELIQCQQAIHMIHMATNKWRTRASNRLPIEFCVLCAPRAWMDPNVSSCWSGQEPVGMARKCQDWEHLIKTMMNNSMWFFNYQFEVDNGPLFFCGKNFNVWYNCDIIVILWLLLFVIFSSWVFTCIWHVN